MNFNCTGLENLEKQKIQWLSYFMVSIELRVSMKVCLTCNSKQSMAAFNIRVQSFKVGFTPFKVLLKIYCTLFWKFTIDYLVYLPKLTNFNDNISPEHHCWETICLSDQLLNMKFFHLRGVLYVKPAELKRFCIFAATVDNVFSSWCSALAPSSS